MPHSRKFYGSKHYYLTTVLKTKYPSALPIWWQKTLSSRRSQMNWGTWLTTGNQICASVTVTQAIIVSSGLWPPSLCLPSLDSLPRGGSSRAHQSVYLNCFHVKFPRGHKVPSWSCSPPPFPSGPPESAGILVLWYSGELHHGDS